MALENDLQGGWDVHVQYCRALLREKTHKIIAGQHIPKALPPQHLQVVKS